MDFNKDTLMSTAHGACFLGAGGGGPLVGALNILESYFDRFCVASTSLDETLQDKDGLTAVVAFIGSPNKATDLVPSMKDVVAAFERINEYAKTKYGGREITYLIPIEVGAVNAIVPFVVAGMVNQKARGQKIRVIDADGAGRAIPMLSMASYAANGLSSNPTTLSKSQNLDIASPCDGYTVSLEIEKAVDVEKLIRPVLDNKIFNNFAGLATWVMDADLLRQAKPIQGTLTMAYDLGRILRKRKKTKSDFSSLGTPIFTGTLVDMQINTADGFDYSLTTFNNQSDIFYLYNQNENIIGWSNLQPTPIIMAPDLICCVAAEFQTPSGSPEPMRVFSNTEQDWSAFKGKKVTVFGRACDESLYREPVAELFRILRQNLGYAGIYHPFKQIDTGA
jgi:hypothetical protein